MHVSPARALGWIVGLGLISALPSNRAEAQPVSNCTGLRPGGSKDILYQFPGNADAPSIGPDGALTLGFNISVPPGYLVPRVGLSYSSRGGDSVLGKGWALSAGASISVDLSMGDGPLREGPDAFRMTSTTSSEFIRGRWVASPGGKLVCESPSSSATWSEFLCYTDPRTQRQYRATGSTWETGFESRDPNSAVTQYLGGTSATTLLNDDNRPVAFLLEHEENSWGSSVHYFYEGSDATARRPLRAISLAGNKVVRFNYTARTTNIRTTYELSIARTLDQLLESVEVLDECTATQGASDTDSDSRIDTYSVTFSGTCSTLEKYQMEYPADVTTRATAEYVVTSITHLGFRGGNPLEQVSYGTTEFHYNGDGVRTHGSEGETSELMTEVTAGRYELPDGAELPNASTLAGPFQNLLDFNGDGIPDLVSTKDPVYETSQEWPGMHDPTCTGTCTNKTRYIFVQLGHEDGTYDSVPAAYENPLGKYAAWLETGANTYVIDANPSGDSADWDRYLLGTSDDLEEKIRDQGWSDATIGINVAWMSYASDGLCLGTSGCNTFPLRPENAFRMESLSSTLTCRGTEDASGDTQWGAVLEGTDTGYTSQEDFCENLRDTYKAVWGLTLDDHDQLGWTAWDTTDINGDGYVDVVVSGNLVVWTEESGETTRDPSTEAAIFVSRFDSESNAFLPFEKVNLPSTTAAHSGLGNEFLSALAMEVVDDGGPSPNDLTTQSRLETTNAALGIASDVVSLAASYAMGRPPSSGALVDLFFGAASYANSRAGQWPEGRAALKLAETVTSSYMRILAGVAPGAVAQQALSTAVQLAQIAIQNHVEHAVNRPGRVGALVVERARMANGLLGVGSAVVGSAVGLALAATVGPVAIVGAVVAVGIAIYVAQQPDGAINNDGDPVEYDIKTKRGLVYRNSITPEHDSTTFRLSAWMDINSDGRPDYVVSNFGRSHLVDSDEDGESDALEEWLEENPGSPSESLEERIARYKDSTQTASGVPNWHSGWLVAPGQAQRRGRAVELGDWLEWEFAGSEVIPYLDASETHHYYVPGHVTHTSLSETKQGLVDMNGDGLVDLVDTRTPASDGYSPRVFLNTRRGFTEATDFLVEDGDDSTPSLCGEGVRIARVRGIDWTEYDANPGPPSSDDTGYMVSGSTQVMGMMDVDGNGLPDLVLRDETDITPGTSDACGVHHGSENCGYAYVTATEPLLGSSACESTSTAWFAAFDGGDQDVCLATVGSTCVLREGASKLTSGAEDVYFPTTETTHYVAFNTGNGFTRYVRITQALPALGGSFSIVGARNAEGAEEPPGKLITGTTNFTIDRTGNGIRSLVALDIRNEALLDPDGTHPVASEYQFGVANADALTSITYPDGGQVEFEYQLKRDEDGDLGQAVWVLAQASFNDGVHGEFASTLPYVKYAYADGKMDRERAEFLGFAYVAEERFSGSDRMQLVQRYEHGDAETADAIAQRGLPICNEIRSRVVFDEETLEGTEQKTVCADEAVVASETGDTQPTSSACGMLTADMAFGSLLPLTHVTETTYTVTGTQSETLTSGGVEDFFRNVDPDLVTVTQYNGQSVGITVETDSDYNAAPYKTLAAVTVTTDDLSRRVATAWTHHDSDWVFLQTSETKQVEGTSGWDDVATTAHTYGASLPYRLERTEVSDGTTTHTVAFRDYALGLAQTREEDGVVTEFIYANEGENGAGLMLQRRLASVDSYRPIAGNEAYAYDAMGRTTSHTDAAGVVTTFEVDGLGLLCSQVDPGQTERTFTYQDVGNPTALRDTTSLASSARTVTEQATDDVEAGEIITKVTYFDGFGRAFRTATAATGCRELGFDFDGEGSAYSAFTATHCNDEEFFTDLEATLLVQDTRLNARGEAQCTSTPYVDATFFDEAGNLRGGEPSAWTTRLVDSLGRPAYSRDTEGFEVAFGFGITSGTPRRAISTTLDDLGVLSYSYQDALGRTVYSNRGLLLEETTSYDDWDHVVETEDASGYRTITEYNAFDQPTATCRQVTSTATASFGDCPSRGTAGWVRTDTTYDARGLVDSTTDGNGNVTSYDNSVCRAPGTTTRPTIAVDLTSSETTVSYDAGCRPVSVVEFNGSQTDTAYGTDGRVASITSAVGEAEEVTVSTTYDGMGRVLFTEDGLGFRQYQVQGFRNELLHRYAPSSTSPVVTHRYGVLGLLTRTHDVFGDISGHRTIYSYNLRGDVLTEARDGIEICDQTTIAADTWATTTPSTWRTTVYARDAKGRITDVTNPEGARSHTDYDALDRVTATIASHASTAGDLDTLTTLSTTYDDVGNVETVSRNEGTSSSYACVTVSYTYDGLHRKLTETAPIDSTTNAVTTYVYDDNGNVLEIHTPNETTTSACVSAAGDEPHMKSFTFNAWNLVQEASDLTAEDGTHPTTVTEYDEAGQVVATESALGHRTEFAYDLLGRRLSVLDPLGYTVSTEYDAIGRVTKTTDQRGVHVTNTYDASGRLVKVAPETGGYTFIGYDEADRKQCELTLANATTGLFEGKRFEYTVDGRLEREIVVSYTSYTEPTSCPSTMTDISSASTCYDEVGRTRATLDPVGSIARSTYNLRGQQTEAMLPRLGTAAWEATTTTYDLQGRPSIVEAPFRGPATTGPTSVFTYYKYDYAGRKVEEQFTQADDIKVYEYDANGNLCAKRDASSVPVEHRHVEQTFDARGLLTERTQEWKTGGSSTFNNSETDSFVYDLDGRLTDAADGSGSWAYGYDDANHITSVERTVSALTTGTNTFTTSYTYYPNGSVNTITYPNLGTSYDGYKLATVTMNLDGGSSTTTASSNRATSLTKTLGTSSTSINVASSFGWDEKNRARAYTLAVQGAGGAVVTKTYDTSGRLSTQQATIGSTTVYDKAFTYNASGSVTSYADNRDGNLSLNFSWDERDRLTSAAGVILSTTTASATYTYGYNTQDLIETATHSVAPATKNKSFTYDSTYGTLSQMVQGTGGSAITTTYARDEFGNRKDRVKAGVTQSVYTSDALNRMYQYTYNVNANTETVEYSHDGRRVADSNKVYVYGIDRMPVVELERSGTTFVEATYNAYLGGNLAQTVYVKPGTPVITTTTTHVWNWQGSPELGIRSGGSAANGCPTGYTCQRMAYGPMGTITTNSAVTSTTLVQGFANTHVGFQENHRDPQTGFNLMGARWYDADTFQWTQPDPIGLGGGKSRFTFANANATKYSDRSGFEPNKQLGDYYELYSGQTIPVGATLIADFESDFVEHLPLEGPSVASAWRNRAPVPLTFDNMFKVPLLDHVFGYGTAHDASIGYEKLGLVMDRTEQLGVDLPFPADLSLTGLSHLAPGTVETPPAMLMVSSVLGAAEAGPSLIGALDTPTNVATFQWTDAIPNAWVDTAAIVDLASPSTEVPVILEAGAGNAARAHHIARLWAQHDSDFRILAMDSDDLWRRAAQRFVTPHPNVEVRVGAIDGDVTRLEPNSVSGSFVFFPGNGQSGHFLGLVDGAYQATRPGGLIVVASDGIYVQEAHLAPYRNTATIRDPELLRSLLNGYFDPAIPASFDESHLWEVFVIQKE